MGKEADAMMEWHESVRGYEDFGSNVPSGVGADWHAQRHDAEPRCGADQWRTRDRSEILYMHEMHDRHLGHCIRFAMTKRQHASRLASLLAERAKRDSST